MASVSIPDVPDDVLRGLECRARARGQTLEDELRRVLVAAAADPQSLELKTAAPNLADPHTNWSREEIYGDDGR